MGIFAHAQTVCTRPSPFFWEGPGYEARARDSIYRVSADHAGSSRSFLDRFSTQGEMLHVYVYACVRGVPRVCVCMHACVDWYGLEMVRPWPARGKICACAFLVHYNVMVTFPSYRLE